MKQFNKYVGLDVPKATIAVSVVDAGGEVRYLGEIANTPETLKKLIQQLGKGNAESVAPVCLNGIYSVLANKRLAQVSSRVLDHILFQCLTRSYLPGLA